MGRPMLPSPTNPTAPAITSSLAYRRRQHGNLRFPIRQPERSLALAESSSLSPPEHWWLRSGWCANAGSSAAARGGDRRGDETMTGRVYHRRPLTDEPPTRRGADAGLTRLGEDPQLEPSRDPGRQDSGGARDALQRLGATRPVLEHEAAVHEVQHPVDEDRGDEDVVQVAQHRNEVRDQVDGRDQVQDGGGQRDLRGLRQHRVEGETADGANDVRQGAQERLHGSRLSATSSLTSLTLSVSSAPFTFRPRSIMARQKGQPVPTRSTLASSASSTRSRFTRFCALTSIHM